WNNNVLGTHEKDLILRHCRKYDTDCKVIASQCFPPGKSDFGQASQIDGLSGLREQVLQLYDRGKSIEAIPFAEQYIEFARKRGEEDPEHATAIALQALLYRVGGRYAQAEPLAKRALAIREKVLGPDNPRVTESLDDLGLLYQSQGRYRAAEM